MVFLNTAGSVFEWWVLRRWKAQMSAGGLGGGGGGEKREGGKMESCTRTLERHQSCVHLAVTRRSSRLSCPGSLHICVRWIKIDRAMAALCEEIELPELEICMLAEAFGQAAFEGGSYRVAQALAGRTEHSIFIQRECLSSWNLKLQPNKMWSEWDWKKAVRQKIVISCSLKSYSIASAIHYIPLPFSLFLSLSLSKSDLFYCPSFSSGLCIPRRRRKVGEGFIDLPLASFLFNSSKRVGTVGASRNWTSGLFLFNSLLVPSLFSRPFYSRHSSKYLPRCVTVYTTHCHFDFTNRGNIGEVDLSPLVFSKDKWSIFLNRTFIRLSIHNIICHHVIS